MKWYQKLFSALRALKNSRRAEITATSIAGLTIAFLVAAIVMPIGITEIANANTTLWETPVITIFTILLPILFVVSVALRMLPGKRG